MLNTRLSLPGRCRGIAADAQSTFSFPHASLDWEKDKLKSTWKRDQSHKFPSSCKYICNYCIAIYICTHQEASPVFLESQSVVPAPCDLAPPIAKVPVHTPAHKNHLHKSQDTIKTNQSQINNNWASIQSVTDGSNDLIWYFYIM